LGLRYLNTTINRKPETQNQRSGPAGHPKTGKTCGLTGMVPDLSRQEPPGRVFGGIRHRTKLFLRSDPGSLASYLDPVLTLLMNGCLQIIGK
jgi:hypothetical protein